jgi:hypothetical protein
MVEKCGAKTRAGRPCQLEAGKGTSHVGIGRCRLHGGASPQAELGGQVELARREAAVMGRPLHIDPHDAILECIRIAAGEVAYLSDKVAELEEHDALGGTTQVKTRPLKGEYGQESLGVTVEEVTVDSGALHAWIVARRQAMDRLVTYSKVALRAGIEERTVRIAEQQGQLLASAIRNILSALGVADHPDAPKVVRRELTLIAGDQAG